VTPEQIAEFDARARRIVGKGINDLGWDDLAKLLSSPTDTPAAVAEPAQHTDADGDTVEVRLYRHRYTGERIVSLVLGGVVPEEEVIDFDPATAREIGEELIAAARQAEAGGAK
jgi:hypothetical protein